MKVFACTIALLFLFTSDVFAVRSFTDESYLEKSTYKLGRGMCNFFGSGAEILRGLDDAQRQYGAHGFCIGITRGMARTLVRAGAGALDIVTFPFVSSRRREYFLKPELATLEGTSVAYKNPLFFQ